MLAALGATMEVIRAEQNRIAYSQAHNRMDTPQRRGKTELEIKAFKILHLFMLTRNIRRASMSIYSKGREKQTLNKIRFICLVK